MTKFDSIIFDLDGTLWDASKATSIGWNIALEKNNLSEYTVTEDDVRSVSGMPFDECFSAVLGQTDRIDMSLFEPVIDEEERLAVIRFGGELYDGAAEGLTELSKEYPLFLISNCQSWYLKAFWNHFNLLPFFKDQDCYGDSGVSKAEMIKNMSIKHRMKNPIYIGDTAGDQQSSKAAGVTFGYAVYGFGDADEPYISFSSFNKLVKFFKSKSDYHLSSVMLILGLRR